MPFTNVQSNEGSGRCSAACMISKCANPSCSKLLMRLDGGRFFGFHTRDRGNVEHFWLCVGCSKTFTLKQSDGRVEVVKREHKKIA